MKIFITLLLCTLLFSSCKKEDYDAITCTNIAAGKATSNSPVNLGGTINFSFPEVGGYRLYRWKGPNNFNEQEASHKITNAELKHEGWYYVTVSNPECGTKTDSVYVDLKLLQGTPTCTVASNKVTYSNLFDDSYTSVLKGYEPLSGLLMLDASIFGSTKIYFHHYWKNKEPEDGIYTTVNIPSFDQFDYNYNKVYISTIKNSINFSSQSSQTIYVSHLNGKLQVRYCNLTMSGSNGTVFSTSASGNIIQTN